MIIFYVQLKRILASQQMLKEHCSLQLYYKHYLMLLKKDTQDLESHKYKREAILWFTTNNGKRKEDFEYICDLAEIEPNYMRRVAMEILTSKRTSFVRNHINALLTHKDSYDRIKLKNKKRGNNYVTN